MIEKSKLAFLFNGYTAGFIVLMIILSHFAGPGIIYLIQSISLLALLICVYNINSSNSNFNINYVAFIIFFSILPLVITSTPRVIGYDIFVEKYFLSLLGNEIKWISFILMFMFFIFSAIKLQNNLSNPFISVIINFTTFYFVYFVYNFINYGVFKIPSLGMPLFITLLILSFSKISKYKRIGKRVALFYPLLIISSLILMMNSYNGYTLSIADILENIGLNQIFLIITLVVTYINFVFQLVDNR